MSALISVRLHAADGGVVPFLGRFAYDRADPYAVGVQFFSRHAALPYWCFDRQMLAEGLHRPVGEGDVTFRPQWTADGEAVRVELRDHPGGQGAVLLVGAPAVAGFLEETYAVTAPGAESFDADGFLEEILAG
ncbi:SsgA family sporulation/cell division regulator [Streptomyces sp. NBC_01565]|uniref:SsgA family sporulation/cell division regulator n=1 Tax=unclassified Streptomyces TaxID=2593676 RepID=UPI002254F448|nr:SsgA family sporulation/cell division regulator [Streptomyces sp. NBC_01565]MCX4539291.1 SsgA family sporulation/cell division regulator [Streptomyces sp. NBC_01565]